MSVSSTGNEERLFGIPRSTAGALCGILLFTFIVTISWFSNLEFVAITLLSPGYFIAFMLAPMILMSLSSSLISLIIFWSIAFGVSIIPPAVLGLLLVSKDKKERNNGIIMLILYFVIVTFFGFPLGSIFYSW